jgi:hypothetical protein
MGVVYAAHDEDMGRPVAIKVLMGDLEHDPESRARFYREAQAAAGLLHPNIITIYDAGEDQGRSFIAMQLLEGWPLAAWVKRPESAPLERKLDLMVQVCDGLAAAHARGIVHRDLKPGNLFVQHDGLLKILDFGVARLADSRMTATGMMLGTPDYMSPEQARGVQVDTRSDIFSVGAVFYFMLAGRKPFPGPDLPAILRQLQFEAVAPLPAGVPAELARIVMGAMAKDPADRPSRIQDLHSALVRFRRAYEAETRRLVAEAQARYAAAADAEQEVIVATQALELSPQYEASAALVRVRETYPGVVDRRATPDGSPPERVSVERALAETEAEQHRLEAEARRYSGWVQAVISAEQQLEGGDARAALRAVDTLQEGRLSSRRLQRLIARAAPAAAEQARIEEQVDTLASAARAAIAAGDWDRAQGVIEQARGLRPESGALIALEQEAATGAAREREKRQREAEASRSRAGAAILAERFDEAAAAIEEAETRDPGAEATSRLRARLAEARAAAEERERVRLLAERAIVVARSAFRRGAYRDAVETLTTFAREHPAAEDVPGEIDRLNRVHARLEQTARARRTQSGTLTAAARTLAAQGAMSDAIGRAREAVLADGADETAVALLGELLDREVADRIREAQESSARTRDAVAGRLVGDARAAQLRGYLGEAYTLASAAASLAPAFREAVTLLDELRPSLASEDESLVPLEEELLGPATTDAATGRAAASVSVEPRPPAAPPEAPRPGSGQAGVLGQMQGWLRRRRTPGA